MHKRRMLAMGEPSGRTKGGIARAAKLSAETRRNIARRAAMVRWARRAPKKDDVIFKLKEIGLDPAVDASVRVRALVRAGELELKRRIASRRKSRRIP
jgi:hypothetical protein